MLNFGRSDRIVEGKSTDKSALKPALYDPPTSAGRGTTANATPRAAPQPSATAARNPSVEPPTLTVEAAVQPSSAEHRTEPPTSKLAVGVNIKLKGVEISDCDVLVIEGHVEATVHSKAMEIAMPGTLKGTAIIDVAEIHGEFSGDLTARTRLVVHGTGRVSGTIRYGKLIVAEGGELNGDVKRLDDASASAQTARTFAPATPAGMAAGSSTGSH